MDDRTVTAPAALTARAQATGTRTTGALSEAAVAVARKIMAAGAVAVGVAALPRPPTIEVDAFIADLAAALFALTSVPSQTWSARTADIAQRESPLRDLSARAAATGDYLLCDLAGLSERGEHGAAAHALHAVIVLAAEGCDDRVLRGFLRELPQDRLLGVVLARPSA